MEKRKERRERGEKEEKETDRDGGKLLLQRVCENHFPMGESTKAEPVQTSIIHSLGGEGCLDQPDNKTEFSKIHYPH